MRLGRVRWWGVAVGAVAAACGGDDTGGGDVRCGAGTVLIGDECVASTGGSAGESGSGRPGGDGPCSGASCAAAGSDATSGTGGTGVASATGGANDSGGAADGPGGEGGSLAAGGNAGEAGGPDETGEAGAPNVDPPKPTKWLAFTNELGVHVYDVEQFPFQDGLHQIVDNGELPVWSPDGSWLAYSSSGNWYSVDMTGDLPGQPNLLSVNQYPGDSLVFYVPRFSWSADSESAAIVGGTTLSVFDPTVAAPTIYPLTTTLTYYQWAPTTDRLFYADATGTHLVEVDAGVPSSPITIDDSARVWAPHGDALAGPKDGSVYLTTLSGASATTVSVATSTAQNPFLGEVTFNHDGTKLAFRGRLDRAQYDIAVVNLTPTVGEPYHPYPEQALDHRSATYSFSPMSDWIAYSIHTDSAGSWYARDLSGATPGPEKLAGAYVPYDLDLAWSPVSTRLFGVNRGDTSYELVTFDPLAANPPLQPLATEPDTELMSLVQVNPLGTVVAYSSTHSLHLVDVANPAPKPTEILINRFTDGLDRVGNYVWSPDAKFIAVVDNQLSTSPDQFQQVLIRTDGSLASSPVRLSGVSERNVAFAFQP